MDTWMSVHVAQDYLPVHSLPDLAIYINHDRLLVNILWFSMPRGIWSLNGWAKERALAPQETINTTIAGQLQQLCIGNSKN